MWKRTSIIQSVKRILKNKSFQPLSTVTEQSIIIKYKQWFVESAMYNKDINQDI